MPKKEGLPEQSVLPSPDMPSTPYLACHFTLFQLMALDEATAKPSLPFLTQDSHNSLTDILAYQ
jgi:hypothetical protein